MTSFQLDTRLERDSLPVCDLSLCTVRLIKDANYPWLLLVPRQNGLQEITDLTGDDQTRLVQEVNSAGTVLKAMTRCDKLNIAALGNMVPQLHIHVIARFRTDKAWPNPVWGAVPSLPYTSDAAEELVRALRDNLNGFKIK